MRSQLRGWFLDRSLNQKLVLIFSIPVLFLVTLSIFTVLVFKKFEAAEDMLERSIYIRGQAIYYLERLYFVQNAFRGYLLTGDRSFVTHYNEAKGELDLAGLELARLVKHSPVHSHADTVASIETATRQLLGEKDAVIARIGTGATGEGLAYIKSGRGLDLVDRISSLLERFQVAEAKLQKERQAAVEVQREVVIWVIVGEGFLILLLSGLGVAMVARSVTQPMSALAASAVQIGKAESVTFPDANRMDEVGLLSRSMAEMDRQIRGQIADLKQSEATLRELGENLALSELRYRSLVEHVPLGIFTTTGQAWTFANPFECELMGLPAGVTPSFEHWRDALHPDDVDRVIHQFRCSVEQEIPFESEFRFVRPDGSVRHILSRGIPVQKSSVGGGFYLCLDLDVSQLVELQERLAPAERLATLTRMATSIAHDLRTPLLGLEQGLRGLKYVAAQQLDHNSQQLLEDLHTGARLAVGIVQDILDLYRQAYGELPLSYSTFHLDDVVREVLELMAAEVRDRRLSILIKGGGHDVWADRRRLFRVMVNLLDNAVKNSPRGGSVTVVLTRQDTRLSVAIEDEGRGFESSTTDKLFEPSRPFSTPTRGGTGLGLYLCRLVIGAHKGTLNAENRPEGGARFTLIFRLMEGKARMAICILIADDQRLFRHSLKMMLERETDLEVVGEASDGQEAYEQGRNRRIDLVLMDVEMPKLDGIAAARALVKVRPDVKILMLSAYADDERVMHGIHAGAVGYIVKDASPEEFVRIIRATVAGQDIVSPYLANLNPVVLARIRKDGGDGAQNVSLEASCLELSPRQQEIVDLLVLGKSNKEMADKLCLSNDTVKAHLQNIFRKIGVSSRLEAVVFLLTGLGRPRTYLFG